MQSPCTCCPPTAFTDAEVHRRHPARVTSLVACDGAGAPPPSPSLAPSPAPARMLAPSPPPYPPAPPLQIRPLPTPAQAAASQSAPTQRFTGKSRPTVNPAPTGSGGERQTGAQRKPTKPKKATTSAPTHATVEKPTRRPHAGGKAKPKPTKKPDKPAAAQARLSKPKHPTAGPVSYADAAPDPNVFQGRLSKPKTPTPVPLINDTPRIPTEPQGRLAAWGAKTPNAAATSTPNGELGAVEGVRSGGSGRGRKHHAIGRASLDAAALPTAGLDLPPSMLDMLPKLKQCTGTLDEQQICYANAVSLSRLLLAQIGSTEAAHNSIVPDPACACVQQTPAPAHSHALKQQNCVLPDLIPPHPQARVGPVVLTPFPRRNEHVCRVVLSTLIFNRALILISEPARAHNLGYNQTAGQKPLLLTLGAAAMSGLQRLQGGRQARRRPAGCGVRGHGGRPGSDRVHPELCQCRGSHRQLQVQPGLTRQRQHAREGYHKITTHRKQLQKARPPAPDSSTNQQERGEFTDRQSSSRAQPAYREAFASAKCGRTGEGEIRHAGRARDVCGDRL